MGPLQAHFPWFMYQIAQPRYNIKSKSFGHKLTVFELKVVFRLQHLAANWLKAVNSQSSNQTHLTKSPFEFYRKEFRFFSSVLHMSSITVRIMLLKILILSNLS